MPRCFLAVPVEEPALAAAGELLERLRAEFEGVRWVRSEGLHLTVHFFGPLPEERWDAVMDAIAPTCAAARPFELGLGGLGAFPRSGPPRVLWLGAVGGVSELTGLVTGCLRRLAAAGVEVESREPAPHCTVGRPRARWERSLHDAWTARPAHLPPFPARRVVLYESVPGQGGSRYAVRRELPLGGDTSARGR